MLIDLLLQAKDEIFDTKISLLIEEKWERVKWQIIRKNCIYFFYQAMVTAHLLLESEVLLIEAILCYQSFLLLQELLEAFREGVSRYFSDYTNWLDFTQGISIVIYGITQIHVKVKEKPDPTTDQKIPYYLLYVAVLLGYWRCLTLIQVFGQGIRTNVIMFQQTIFGLAPFLCILILFQISFTVSDLVIKDRPLLALSGTNYQ